MNRVILMGRLTKDPEVRYSQGAEPTCIARYTLAVDRKYKVENQPSADFIRCIVFGKPAEWAEKYLKKGMKICVSGRIQTGSYTNDSGQTVYTTDVICDEQEFAESKHSNEARNAYDDQMAQAAAGPGQRQQDSQLDSKPENEYGFIPTGPDTDEELPFS